ncbi:MAG: hypothetical protein M3319_03130 [Actinomycetota bacterium]|nr:hypothetical protein [Actinomycetota bacterium]
MTAHYTIRYRCNEGATQTALIVEDAQGRAYLFRGGWLRREMRGNAASARLAGLLAEQTQERWLPVPTVAGYTLEELRRLTCAAAASGTRVALAPPQDGEVT